MRKKAITNFLGIEIIFLFLFGFFSVNADEFGFTDTPYNTPISAESCSDITLKAFDAWWWGAGAVIFNTDTNTNISPSGWSFSYTGISDYSDYDGTQDGQICPDSFEVSDLPIGNYSILFSANSPNISDETNYTTALARAEMGEAPFFIIAAGIVPLFQIPTGISQVQNNLTDQLANEGTILLIALLIGLPLTFYVIHHIISLLRYDKKSGADKRG
jgi:hypothetical protein